MAAPHWVYPDRRGAESAAMRLTTEICPQTKGEWALRKIQGPRDWSKEPRNKAEGTRCVKDI
jgi:hypothetical protein